MDRRTPGIFIIEGRASTTPRRYPRKTLARTMEPRHRLEKQYHRYHQESKNLPTTTTDSHQNIEPEDSAHISGPSPTKHQTEGPMVPSPCKRNIHRRNR